MADIEHSLKITDYASMHSFVADSHQNNLSSDLDGDEDALSFSMAASRNSFNGDALYSPSPDSIEDSHDPGIAEELFYSTDPSIQLSSFSTMNDTPCFLNYSDYLNCTLTNGTYIPDKFEFSTIFQVVIYIMYNSVFIAAVLGNILVCYVVFSSPRMRTVTNYLIANLAVGDLLMAVLCVPFSYISVLLQYWPFGYFLCHVVSPAQAVCVFVSAYTLVALAADRYIAILYPLKPRLRRSQAVMVIVIVWVVAILTALPIAIFTRLNIKDDLPLCEESGWEDDNHKLAYSLTLMILQYFFPLGVLIFTYTRIAMAVWGKKAPGEAEDARDQRLAKAKRKMIKMMLTVMIVYTVSWLPFNTLVVCGDIWPRTWNWPYMSYLFPMIHWMALSHTVCNPIIYCWMNSRFRAGFRSAISNVPFLRKMGITGGDGHRLTRTNTTCTTYTFGSAGGHNGKLGRGSSLISNKTSLNRGYSTASDHRNLINSGNESSTPTGVRSFLGRSTNSRLNNNFGTHQQHQLTLTINGVRRSSRNDSVSESFM